MSLDADIQYLLFRWDYESVLKPMVIESLKESDKILERINGTDTPHSPKH